MYQLPARGPVGSEFARTFHTGLPATATDARARRSAPLTPPVAGRPATFGVASIDDPRGSMRLVAVRGELNHQAICSLTARLEDLGAGDSLHLDLSDATFGGSGTPRDGELIGAAIERLEVMVEELEVRGVRVRIVGLDPNLPGNQHRKRS